MNEFDKITKEMSGLWDDISKNIDYSNGKLIKDTTKSENLDTFLNTVMENYVGMMYSEASENIQEKVLLLLEESLGEEQSMLIFQEARIVTRMELNRRGQLPSY